MWPMRRSLPRSGRWRFLLLLVSGKVENTPLTNRARMCNCVISGRWAWTCIASMRMWVCKLCLKLFLAAAFCVYINRSHTTDRSDHRIWVFGYGSLINKVSASVTARTGVAVRAVLLGYQVKNFIWFLNFMFISTNT